jgi:two-component system alkaline phosphatase synthesis response regulator PhoP
LTRPAAPAAAHSHRVLIVEDEAHLAQGLRFNLEAEGYSVEVEGDGEAATMRLLENKEPFDAVVLDVMLPGIDGFQVAAALRAARNFVPVLMLTARGRPEDVLKGFGAGADDYLPKPFELSIFLARLQGLLRRMEWVRAAVSDARRSPAVAERSLVSASSAKPAKDRCAIPASPGPSSPAGFELFSFDGKTIDFGALELCAKGTTIHLTLMEARLLRHLIQNAGRTVSRKSILEEVWGLKEDTDTRAIDNFIVRLRRYIEDNPAKPRHVRTVRGVGYRFIV